MLQRPEGPLRLGSGLLGLGLSFLLCRLLLFGSISRGSLGLTVVGRCPQGEVVPEQLHDQGAVTVRFLGQGVELGDGIVEGLLGEVAGAVGGVQDLVIEDREVQGQTQADRVSGSELGLSDIGGALEKDNLSATQRGFIYWHLEPSLVFSPCKPRGQPWRRSCASHQRRTQRGNGGSHPSCSG